MFSASIHHVHKNNPEDNPYAGFVLFQRVKSDTIVEKEIRLKHEDIDTALSEQNFLYSEITTSNGKAEILQKFNIKDVKYPLFLILDKHPSAYKKNDKALLIQWGKYKDAEIETMKNDLMTLVNFITDEETIKNILSNTNLTKWDKFLKLLKDHETLIKTGVTIATAVV